MSQLRASIIINNYNYARYVGDAIDSALAQTYPHTEVIVVDDGSTDRSREIIESYDNRITSVLKANGGQASAYNAGFAVSSGEAICFLDSDDTMFPQAMEQAMQLMKSGKPAKVQWPLAFTDAAGRPTGELSTRSIPPHGNLREMVTRNGPFYDWYLTTGALYPRWLLEQLLPIPESPYRLGSDEYLTTIAPVFGDVLNHPDPLATYRNHGGNNYYGRDLDDRKIHEYMQRFEVNCSALREQLQRFGVEADVEGWKRRNFNYVWPQRLLQAKADIARMIPPGANYILINGDEWGRGEPVPGRHAIPFLEKANAYAGPPADDSEAIRELERLRQSGASAVVIWWTSFWWLEHYCGFANYLQKFPVRLRAEHMIVFNIRTESMG